MQARALGPSATPATTIDYNNGTYGVRFRADAVGEYRVEVRLDNVKIKGSPHVIMFTEGTAAEKRKAELLAGSAADPPADAPASCEVVDADGNVLPVPPPSATGERSPQSKSPQSTSPAGERAGDRNSRRASDVFP